MTSNGSFKTVSGPVSILITGANQGIGLYTSEILASTQDGLTLYVGARSKEKAQGTVDKLKTSAKPDAKLIPLVLDVSNDESIKAAASSIDSLDILVNNAGIADTDPKDLAAQRKLMMDIYNTNVFGPANMITAFLPALRKAKANNKNRRPAIVNVSSEVGSITGIADGLPEVPFLPQYLAYPSSKAALNFVTAWASRAYEDIRVCSCTPGYCATNLNANSGPKPPQEGAKLIVEAILDEGGKTARYYGENGKPLPW